MTLSERSEAQTTAGIIGTVDHEICTIFSCTPMTGAQMDGECAALGASDPDVTDITSCYAIYSFGDPQANCHCDQELTRSLALPNAPATCSVYDDPVTPSSTASWTCVEVP